MPRAFGTQPLPITHDPFNYAQPNFDRANQAAKAKAAQMAAEAFGSFLGEVLEKTGLDLQNAAALVASLGDLVVRGAEQFIEQLLELTGIDLSSPQALADSIAQFVTVTANQVINLVRDATGIDLSTVANLAGSIASALTITAGQIVGGLLRPTVVPPLQDLFGLLTGGQIKDGAVTQDKVATRDPSNLVWNGDFEDGWTSWNWQTFTSGALAEVQSAKVYQGTRALRLKGTASGSADSATAWSSVETSCTPGAQFTVTSMWYSDAALAGGSKFGLQGWSPNGGWAWIDPDSATAPGPAGQWNRRAALVTVPEGVSKVRVSVWALGSDEFWMDVADLRRAYATAQDVQAVGNTTADLSKAVVTLANATYAANAYVQPFSRTGGNPYEDNTYGRDLLTYQAFRGDVETGEFAAHYHQYSSGTGGGTMNTSSAGAHSHVIARSGSMGMPLFTPTLGRLYVLPISCERDRLYSQAVLQTTGTALPSKFLLAVGQIDRTTGAVTRVYDFGDVRGSIAAQSDATQLVDQIFNTTVDVSSSAGSLNCLLMLQTGGVATPIAAVVNDRPRQMSSVPLYPKYLTGYSTATNLTAIPETVANSSLATANLGAWLWGALSQPYANQLDQDSTYLDDFNRSNANTLGSMWTVSPNNFQINANAAQLAPNGLNLGGRATAIHTQAFRSNNQSVEVTIKSFSTTGQFGVILRRNPQGAAQAQMVVKKDKVTFETVTANGTTEYASAAISNVQAGAKFRLSVSGSAFTGYLNNAPLWTVNDTSGVLANGTQTRNWGFFADYQAFNSGVPSPIDGIVATSTVS